VVRIAANRITVGWFASDCDDRGSRRGTSVAFSLSVTRLPNHRDRFSHTRLCASIDALEEWHMEFIARLKKFARADEGQDLLEYALLVALIALVCVVSIGLAGSNVNTIFNSIAGKLVVPAA